MRTDEFIYYNVNVSFKVETDEGKEKKIKEKYLVKAIGCTDAEAIVTKEFTGTNDFKVESIAETKIINVLEADMKDE
jgi:hypothetical protein